MNGRDAKIKELRTEINRLAQENEDQKGIILSLEHHVKELESGLVRRMKRKEKRQKRVRNKINKKRKAEKEEVK